MKPLDKSRTVAALMASLTLVAMSAAAVTPAYATEVDDSAETVVEKAQTAPVEDAAATATPAAEATPAQANSVAATVIDEIDPPVVGYWCTTGVFGGDFFDPTEPSEDYEQFVANHGYYFSHSIDGDFHVLTAVAAEGNEFASGMQTQWRYSQTELDDSCAADEVIAPSITVTAAVDGEDFATYEITDAAFLAAFKVSDEDPDTYVNEDTGDIVMFSASANAVDIYSVWVDPNDLIIYYKHLSFVAAATAQMAPAADSVSAAMAGSTQRPELAKTGSADALFFAAGAAALSALGTATLVGRALRRKAS